MCPRVIIIDRGHRIFDGSVEAIRSQYGSERLLAVEFEDEIPDFAPPSAVLRRSEGRKKWFSFNRHETSASALIAAISAGYPVADLTVEDTEIEEVIRAIYLDKAARISEQKG
jgi:ABC-2 type transport system ATP-binding protein